MRAGPPDVVHTDRGAARWKVALSPTRHHWIADSAVTEDDFAPSQCWPLHEAKETGLCCPVPIRVTKALAWTRDCV